MGEVMGRAIKATFAVLVFSMLAGCVTQLPPRDYSALRAEDPHSILVVPAVNRSTDVDAAGYYLSTVPIPVASRGYYVFPVNMVRRVMEDDGLSDADFVHNADPVRLGQLFGADSILYVTIERWDARYIVLATTVTVDLSYVLKSGKTGNVLWTSRQHVEYTPQAQNSGGGIGALLVMAVQAAVAKAAPDYIPLASMANAQAVGTPGQGLPAGPRSSGYHKDDVPK